ncbi:MAG TPA: hypothetical protein VFZ17_05600 [Acidimicrobiia bacterium]|nr:hypothetical protein [Acidimicrobiia bacterium]
MPAYPFLSDEWFVEVRRIIDAGAIEVPPGANLRMNLVVTATPFESDRLVHVVMAEGEADWGQGHLQVVDLTITADYATARELFISGDLQGALQALLEGRIKLQGDLTKLMAAQAAGAGPGSPGLAEALADITA